METPPVQVNHEIFVHIRILIGMILGLSVGRLVSGAVRFIQQPGKDKIYRSAIPMQIYSYLTKSAACFLLH